MTGIPRGGRRYLRREQGSFVSPGLHVQCWVIRSEDPGPYERLRMDMARRDAAVLETKQRQLLEEGEPRRDLNMTADRAALRARHVTRAMVAEENRPTARSLLAGGCPS